MTKSKKIMIGALPFAALIVLFAVFCGIVSSKGSLFQVMIVHCRLKPVRKIRFIMRLLLELLIRSSLKNIRQMSTSLVRLDQAWIQSMKLV